MILDNKDQLKIQKSILNKSSQYANVNKESTLDKIVNGR